MVENLFSDDVLNRVWKPDKELVRVFISHIHKYKLIASDLKSKLMKYGITSFVAHEDIEPTKVWMEELNCALNTFDVFIALLTPHFNASDWTDQEVGFAISRDKLIIPVNMGITPYGFLSKFQDIKLKHYPGIEIEKLCKDILPFIEEKIPVSKMVNSWILGLKHSRNFASSNFLLKEKLSPVSGKLSIENFLKIQEISDSNKQVSGANEFKPLIENLKKRFK